tara:strand:- start:31 stop:693 length:663 start_codon:yes stop_codon:yes gene_type:complete
MAYLNVNRKGFITGPSESSQSAARDAASGTATDSTSGTQTAVQYYFNTGRGNTHRYIRAFLHFDTSGISSGGFNSPTIDITGAAYAHGNVIGIKHTAGEATGGVITDDDFNNVDFATAYTASTEWTTSGMSIELSAAAASDVINNDHFNIAIVGIEDYNDTAEPLEESGNISRGIDFDGTLRLQYSTGGYGHKVAGVAAASIAEVSTVATASIGKINTVD